MSRLHTDSPISADHVSMIAPSLALRVVVVVVVGVAVVAAVMVFVIFDPRTS